MRKFFFWLVTVLFALAMLAGGLVDIFSAEAAAQIVALGYPTYLPTFLGVAKVLGALALVFHRRYPRLAEWAYAGFAFDLIGAAYSEIASGAGWKMTIPAIAFLAVLALSYRLRGSCGACRGGSCSSCARGERHGR